MKFLHIADLHIGKCLNQKSLLEDQKIILDQIVKYMEDYNVEVLMLAGDIYDKQIPSKEAVNLFNDFLCDLILKHHYKVYIISGNHDSVERLNFASSILKNEGLYIETYANVPISKYEFYDEYGKVNLYMLPYSSPLYTRVKFDSTCNNYSEMIKYYVENSNIDFSKRNILLTHHTFLHDNMASFSDSEVRFNIGGTEGIDAAYFKDFDYVALGHLHNPQYVNRPHIRYSGSILKYSESEVNIKKVALMVELKEKGNIEITELPLIPLHDLKKIKGTIDELLVNPDVLDEDYVYVTLTNDTIIPYAMKRIRLKYPNALSLTYERLSKQLIDKTIDTTDFKEKSIKDQFNEFYKFINNKELSDNQISILDKILEKVEEE
ncbi:MAG: exonuclease SbcCD subunit D [Bacilli bacterium]|nr:exonuclease SbcCD subunit D [Bacilli bacterium]